MKFRKLLALPCLCALLIGSWLCAPAQALPVGPITFTAADYDNTANTVTAGPVTHYNQGQGAFSATLFRDIFWYSLNNGAPRVGSGDYINQGNSLVLSGNHAVPGPGAWIAGQGPYTALNFTGPSISGGQSYLAIYDTTPGDGAATKNVFDGSHLIISADILFVKHSSSGGIVALYNEGQDGLALLAHNGDGNNADHARIDLVFQSPGAGTVLSSVTLDNDIFRTAASANGNKTPGTTDFWYRAVMDLTVTGDAFSLTGTFFDHSDPNNPNSSLVAGAIATVSFNGSISDPDAAALHLTNPGEVGLMAQGNESISLPDNTGISITNFQVDDGSGPPEEVIPEPMSIALLGSGLVSLMVARKKNKSL